MTHAGVHPLVNTKIWVAEYDISGITNATALPHGAKMLPANVFGGNTEIFAPGLKTNEWRHVGLFDVETAHDGFWSQVGNVTGKPMTVAPEASDEGDTVFIGRVLAAQYEVTGSQNDLAKFTFGGRFDTELVPSTLMAKGTYLASTDETARQLGAVSVTQFMYAALHVTDSSDEGTEDQTCNVTIESDATNAFSGSETTRGTFTQVTTLAASQWLVPVAGAITDTWWRVVVTIAGTDTPSFTLGCSIGIL